MSHVPAVRTLVIHELHLNERDAQTHETVILIVSRHFFFWCWRTQGEIATQLQRKSAMCRYSTTHITVKRLCGLSQTENREECFYFCCGSLLHCHHTNTTWRVFSQHSNTWFFRMNEQSCEQLGSEEKRWINVMQLLPLILALYKFRMPMCIGSFNFTRHDIESDWLKGKQG